MAIRTWLLDLAHTAIHEVKKPYKEIRLLDLGNQYVKDYTIKVDGKKVYLPSKKYFSDCGVSHTSIDMNGKDGVMVMDLASEIKSNLRFDVVFNFGTGEHVEDQYNLFRNIHNFCSPDGFMVHTFPIVKFCKKHGNYNYSEDFAFNLAWANNYDIIYNDIRKHKGREKKNEDMLFSCVIYQSHYGEFISRKEFIEIKKIHRVKGFNNEQT